MPESPDKTERDSAAGVATPVDGETFGEYYYRHDCGIPYERSKHWLTFFGRIADRIVSDLKPSTSLDAGCAIGLLVEQLRERGVDAKGVDISDYAIQQMPEGVQEHCWVASLTEPIPGRYDLVTCIEVVEHMPAADAPAAIRQLCAVSDRVLLSSSPLDYSEPTHLNVQPPEYWSALMADNGFVRHFEYDASYLTPWATLYLRQPGGVGDMIRAYDRSWCRLRDEVQETRLKVLDLQDKLGLSEAQGTEVTFHQEYAELKQEVLRRRDELIGKDAELGGAKGRLAELDSIFQTYEGMRQRLEAMLNSRSWRLTQAAGAPLRKLRERKS